MYFLLLVLPVAYAFLFDSAHLNIPSPERQTRVLTLIALALIVVSVAGLQIANQELFPGQSDYGDLGLALAQAPLAVLLLWTLRLKADDLTDHSVTRTESRRLPERHS